MADGRKNNGGHSTKGRAGRPPKADELKKIEMMDSIAEPKEVWTVAWKLVKSGDTQALRMWIEHRFGKPKERVDVTSNDETLGQQWNLSELSDSQLQALIALHGGHDTGPDA